jgi:hypothetical protein
MTPAFHRIFAILATLSVVASVAWGFTIVGSPDTRRQERMDDRRLEALRDIQREIQELLIDPEEPGVLRRALPASLDELAAAARDRKIEQVDPETLLPYEYRVLSGSTYELCAVFQFARDAKRAVFWNHPAGRCCFRIDVLDPPE